jgi:hypothetical protein
MLNPLQKELEIKYDNWLDGLHKIDFDFGDSLTRFEEQLELDLPMTDEFEQALQESYDFYTEQELAYADYDTPSRSPYDLTNITSPSGE